MDFEIDTLEKVAELIERGLQQNQALKAENAQLRMRMDAASGQLDADALLMNEAADSIERLSAELLVEKASAENWLREFFDAEAARVAFEIALSERDSELGKLRSENRGRRTWHVDQQREIGELTEKLMFSQNRVAALFKEQERLQTELRADSVWGRPAKDGG